MTVAELIGVAAALCSTVSFAPQAVKIIRTRDTRSISVGMYALTVAAFSMWTVYGVMQQEWPLIISNAVCLFLSAFIFVMKLLPADQKSAVAEIISASSPESHK